MSTWDSKMAMKLFPMIIGIPLYFSSEIKNSKKRNLYFSKSAFCWLSQSTIVIF